MMRSVNGDRAPNAKIGTTIVAPIMNAVNARRRPKRSANHPKVMYPTKAPACSRINHAADLVIVNPPPPFSTGVARNAGSHVITPQYAISTLLARSVAVTVRRRNGGENISVQRDGSRFRSRHSGGSATL